MRSASSRARYAAVREDAHEAFEALNVTLDTTQTLYAPSTRSDIASNDTDLGFAGAVPDGIDRGTDPRPVVVLGVTTWNRLPYIRRFVESFVETRSRHLRWALVIADDGSTDGTIEYLRDLSIPDCQVVLIENKNASVAGQTNSILRAAEALGFDFGIKCDDDIFFSSSGWDESYFRAAIDTGYHHLVYHNPDWKEPEHRKHDGRVQSNVQVMSAMGCLWTFSPKVLEDVGYFDEYNFKLRGHAHLDYSMRCCRAGYNEADNLWDAADSASLVSMWNRDGYLETIDWSSPEVRAVLSREERQRRMDLIAQHPRIHISFDAARTKYGRAHVQLNPRTQRGLDALTATGRFTERCGLELLVDGTFVLNLRHDAVKWAETAATLGPYIRSFERLPATNGNHPDLAQEWEEYNSQGLLLDEERTLNRRLIASPGAWGYLYTMRELLQAAKARRYRRVMVLDDDVLLHQDFDNLVERVIEELPPTWRLVYLGCTERAWDEVQPYSEHLYRPGDRVNGSFAYIIDCSVFDEVLDELEMFDAPFDSGPLSTIRARYPSETFVARPNLVIADVSGSDLRKGRDQSTFAAAAKWVLGDYGRNRVGLNSLPRRRALPRGGSVSAIMVLNGISEGFNDAVESLRRQTHGNWECLVLLNGVSDVARSETEAAARADSRVRVLWVEQRMDSLGAFNLLVRHADGEYITILSPQESSSPQRLASLLELLKPSEALAVAGKVLHAPGAFEWGRVDGTLTPENASASVRPHLAETVGAGMIRKDVFDAAGDLLFEGEEGFAEAIERAGLVEGTSLTGILPAPEVPVVLSRIRPSDTARDMNSATEWGHDGIRQGLKPVFRRRPVRASVTILDLA